MPQFRITLDVPYQFSVEPGLEKAVHCADFAPQKGLFDKNALWRDDTTGIVMLSPSVRKRDFAKDFKSLDDFDHNPDFWRKAQRAVATADTTQPPSSGTLLQLPAQMMASIKPVSKPHSDIELVTGLLPAIAIVEALIAAQDTLKWVLRSTFTLAADESFAIHYHGVADEMHRKKNWFAVQWDNIMLAFSHAGEVRVYHYPDRVNMKAQADLVDTYEIASPGDLLNRDGSFLFVPLPGLGLLLVHSLNPQHQQHLKSSTQAHGYRSVLIPWPAEADPDTGFLTLFRSSTVLLAKNPYQQDAFGYQSVTFDTGASGAGSFNDGAFDPGYMPLSAPYFTHAEPLHTGKGAVSATLQNATGTADWMPGRDRIGSAKLTLSTSDKRYSPFLFSYSLGWKPVLATRGTAPVVLSRKQEDGYTDKLTRLEWTDNELGDFEGTISFLLSSAAAKKIALRGDSTFILEYSQDNGANWYVFTGGLCKQWHFALCYAPGWGTYFEGTAKLLDMWERVGETHVLWQTAFDGRSIAVNANVTLMSAGFPAIPDAELPLETRTAILQNPPDGHNWRFAPKEGEKGREILLTLLLFLRRQNLEYRVRFNWSAAKWILEKRPRDVATVWQLRMNGDMRNEAGRVWPITSCDIDPEPPEANVTLADGLTRNDTEAKRLPSGPLVNLDSVSNVDSIDYLGRMVYVRYAIPNLTSDDEIKKMNARLFDAVAHHRLKCAVETSWFTWLLAPNVRCQIRDTEGALIGDVWIKRRTVVIENEGLEQTKFSCDSNWGSELPT